MPEDPDQEQADRIQLRFDEVNRRVLGEEARTDVLSGNRRAVFSVKPLRIRSAWRRTAPEN